MKRLCCWIFLLALPLILTACSGSKQLLADKDRLVADKDREITGLRAELKELQAQKARADREITGSRAELKELQAQKVRASSLGTDLKKALANLEAERKLRVKGNRIVMQNAVLFASGSVTITADGKKVLDEIWNALANYLDRDILIEGHTDNVPIAQKYQGKYTSNWELSCARSLAVLRYYVREKKGAEPSRLGALGYGEYRPIADNSTEEGRNQNRRVVIVVGSKD